MNFSKFREHAVRKFLSVSHRSVNLSVTRSHPGNFTFRTREFEQMELEFFCKPDTDLEWFEYWRGFCRDWLFSLEYKKKISVLRDHDKEELASIKSHNRL